MQGLGVETLVKVLPFETNHLASIYKGYAMHLQCIASLFSRCIMVCCGRRNRCLDL